MGLNRGQLQNPLSLPLNKGERQSTALLHPSSKKSRRALLLGLIILIILTPLSIYLARTPESAKADWFDDAYRYRVPLTFGNTGSPDADKRVKFDIDTASLIASDKLTATCSDIRFTDLSGNPLQYFLDSSGGACNTASTDFWVLLPTIHSGTNTVLMYYGSPLSESASVSVQFSQTEFSPTSGPSVGSEQMGDSPAGFWRFDIGHDLTAYDISPNQNHAIVGLLPTVGLEQQIYIPTNSNAVNGTSYTGVANGHFKWTSASYPNATVYFEAIIKNNGGHTTSAGLLDIPTNTLVTGAEVTTTSATFTLVRSGAITLTDNTVYYPQVKTSNAAGTAEMKLARLIIVQSAPEKLTATQTNLHIATPTSFTSNTSYDTLGITNKTYVHDTSFWQPAPTIYFEATLYGTQAGDTHYAALFETGATCTTQVTGSEVSTSGTTHTHVRSSAITLENGKGYMVCLKRTGTGTSYIRSGSLILVQSDSTGIQSLQLNHQYFNHTPTDIFPTTYTSQYGLNTYTPGNFTGGTFTRYFESSISVDTGSTGYLQLYDITNSAAISGSEISHTTDVTTRKTSGSLNTTLPTSTATLDFQAKNETSSINYQFPRLLTTTTDLSIPDFETRPLWQSEDRCISGKCLWFDGQAQALTIENTPTLNLDSGLSNGFTFQGWVRVNSDGGNDQGHIFWKGDSTFLKTTNQGSDNLADLEASLDLTTTNATLTATNAISLNRWHYVALTYHNDSSDIITLYVDGRKVAESSNGSGSPSTDTNHLLVGGKTGYHYHGFIDEFKLYPYARTPTQLNSDFIKLATFKGSSAVFGASQSQLSDGLIAYWDLNETASPAADLSGNNHLGYWVEDATHSAGLFGNALDFDGTDDYLTSAVNGANLEEVTVSLWVNPDQTLTDNRGIFKWSLETTSGVPFIWIYRVSGSTNISFWVDGASGYFSTPISNSAWSHITLTIDKNNIWQAYVNGISVGTHTSDSSWDGQANASNIFVGRSTYAFDGQVDEVRVYNRALPPNEVKELYQWAPGPIAHWKFDEASGDAQDSTIYANHLTNYNSVTYSPGKFGNAANFDASSAMYQYVGSNSYLSLPASFSISAWIKPYATAGGTHYNIAGKWDNENTSYQFTQYEDELRLYLNDDTTYVTTTTANIQANTWYHVQSVYDAAAQTVQIFVNGVNQTTTTTGTIPSSIKQNDSRFHISGQDSTSFGGTLDVQVAASADDAHEIGNGAMNVTGLNLNMHSSATTTTRSHGAFRWSLNVEQGTTVLSAYLKGLTTSNDDPYVTIHAEAIDNAPVFTTSSTNITSRSRTSASVLWDETNLGTTIVTSPDIKDVIQEVLDRPGWEPNNYLALITVPSSSVERLFTFRPYDYTTVNQPSLVLEFEQSDTKFYYDGILDDVKIYNYARTPEQVIQDMNASHPAPGSPVGSALIHYKFDEGYEDTVNNSGSGGPTYNGTRAGSSKPTWTNDGKFGKALDFDGNGYVNSINTPHLTGGFTLCSWFNWNGTGSPNGDKIATDHDSGGSDVNYGLQRNTSGKLEGIFRATNDSWYTAASTTTIASSTWYHGCIVHDTQTLRVYINGIQDGTSTSVSGLTPKDSTGVFSVGQAGSLTSTNNTFNGKIDELKLYNFALTPEQIKVEHNQGQAQVWGATSTTSTGEADNSAAREYCVPGDTATCNSPISHWKFDENTATAFNDDSGNDNSGTITGPTWVLGKYGSALAFDGSDDYALTTGNTTFNPANTFTLSAWIKPESFGEGGVGSFISKLGVFDVYTRDSNDSVAAYFHSSGNYAFSETNSLVINSSNPQWYHVTIIHNGSGTFTFYINGVKRMGTGSDSTANGVNSSAQMIFGSTSTGGAEAYDGSLDEVKIYDYERTPAQIAWDFNRGAPQWHLKLDQTSGSTAYDSGPLSINATLQGNAVFNITSGQCKSGYCVSLDGTDDYLSTANFSPLTSASQTTTNASWGGWYYLTTSGASKALLEKGTELKLTTTASSKAVCDIYTSSAFTTNTAAITNPALSLATWHHLLCTYDGTTIKLYQNGNQVDSWSQTGAITAASTAAYAGSSSTGSGDVEGRLDDQYLFNFPLTPLQINTLMNQGAVNFGN